MKIPFYRFLDFFGISTENVYFDNRHDYAAIIFSKYEYYMGYGEECDHGDIVTLYYLYDLRESFHGTTEMTDDGQFIFFYEDLSQEVKDKVIEVIRKYHEKDKSKYKILFDGPPGTFVSVDSKGRKGYLR